MITFPLVFPAGIYPKSVSIDAVNLIGANQSPFTGEVETQENAGEWIEQTLTFPPIRDPILGEQLVGFLKSLRAQSGSFLAPDFSRLTVLGSPAGSPVCNGVQASGSKVLVTKSWTPNRAIARAGDVLQLGTSPQRLFWSLKDVSSDASGNATFDVWPRLREQLADGTAVVYTNPKGQWMLNQAKSSWSKDEAGIYTITLCMREDL